MSTVKAAFGGGIPLVNLDQGPSIPGGFVFQLGHKLRPAHVTDRFGKGRVLDHVLHLQTLHTDRLVFTDQASREFVREITATISDASMKTSHFLASLLSILGPLFLPGMSPLSFCQLLLILVEEVRVAYHFSIREHHEGLQAQVSTNGASVSGKNPMSSSTRMETK